MAGMLFSTSRDLSNERNGGQTRSESSRLISEARQLALIRRLAAIIGRVAP